MLGYESMISVASQIRMIRGSIIPVDIPSTEQIWIYDPSRFHDDMLACVNDPIGSQVYDSIESDFRTHLGSSPTSGTRARLRSCSVAEDISIVCWQ